MKKMLKIMLVSLAVILTLSACAQSNANTVQELKLALTNPMNTLNHIINSESVNSQVIANFTEGLLTYDETQQLIGAMAKSWDTSEDGLTYTFHLRDGIEWSNGTPVTAKDFVFTWHTIATNDKAAYTKSLVDANIKNASDVIEGKKPVTELGVVAQDDKTLVVSLDAPSLLFLPTIATTTFNPINEEFYNSVGAEQFGTSPETVLANGAFVITSWQPDSGYVLEKNDKYWDVKNVKLNKVSVRVIKETATQATLYDEGEIDRLAVSTTIYDRYKDDPNLTRQNEAAWFYLYFSGNNGNKSPVLGNRNFRAALAHALDKQLLTDNILKNGSIPSNGIVPHNFDNLDGKDFRTYANQFNESIFDVQKAQAYLETAKRELPNEDFSFELVITDSEAAKLFFENIKSQIEAALPGVNVKLTTIPSNTFFSKLHELETPASYAGWSPGQVDVFDYFSIFRSDSSNNFGRWSNAEFDNLIALAIKETDPQKRWDYFVQAEKILIEDYAVVPLYQRGALAVMNPKVKNYIVDPTTSRVLFKYVYIEE